MREPKDSMYTVKNNTTPMIIFRTRLVSLRNQSLEVLDFWHDDGF